MTTAQRTRSMPWNTIWPTAVTFILIATTAWTGTRPTGVDAQRAGAELARFRMRGTTTWRG